MAVVDFATPTPTSNVFSQVRPVVCPTKTLNTILVSPVICSRYVQAIESSYVPQS
jgi:hypothetical protein